MTPGQWDSIWVTLWPAGSSENLSCFTGISPWLLKKNAQIMQPQPQVRAIGRQTPALSSVLGFCDLLLSFWKIKCLFKMHPTSFWFLKYSSALPRPILSFPLQPVELAYRTTERSLVQSGVVVFFAHNVSRGVPLVRLLPPWLIIWDRSCCLLVTSSHERCLLFKC